MDHCQPAITRCFTPSNLQYGWHKNSIQTACTEPAPWQKPKNANATAEFQKLSEAYETLSDPYKRSSYGSLYPRKIQLDFAGWESMMPDRLDDAWIKSCKRPAEEIVRTWNIRSKINGWERGIEGRWRRNGGRLVGRVGEIASFK
jgi:hypothetical protein